MKHHRLHLVFLLLLPRLLASIGGVAAAGEPPTSPEVTAAMQRYLDSYKLAGYVAIVADKTVQSTSGDQWAARDLFLKTVVGLGLPDRTEPQWLRWRRRQGAS